MDLNINLYNILILFGMAQSFIFGIILYLRSRLTQGHKHLAITVLILALYLGWVLKYDFGFQFIEPRLQHLPLVFLWGIGPSFYAYIRHQVGRPLSSIQLRYHYLPILIEFMCFCMVNTAIFFQNKELLQTGPLLHFICRHYFSIDHLIGLLSMLVYFIGSWKTLNPFSFRPQFFSLKRLLLAFGLLWLIWLPYTLYDSLLYNFNFPPSGFYFFYLMLALLTYCLGFIGFQIKKWQQIKSGKVLEADEKRQLQRLLDLIEKEEWYLKPDLNIREVGRKLDLHPNRISHLVNAGLNCGFRDLINSYRVRHLKKKLSDRNNHQFTILSLGYECGFNSKASINRVFKKQEGLTPQEFRKKATQNAF